MFFLIEGIGITKFVFVVCSCCGYELSCVGQVRKPVLSGYFICASNPGAKKNPG
ncbi:hypothetical protein D3C80_2134090 [compost metagenome]